MQYYGISAENTIIFEDSKEGISAAKATGASIYKIVKFKKKSSEKQNLKFLIIIRNYKARRK